MSVPSVYKLSLPSCFRMILWDVIKRKREEGRTKTYGLGHNDFLGMQKCWFVQTCKRVNREIGVNHSKEKKRDKEEEQKFELTVPITKQHIVYWSETFFFVCIFIMCVNANQY